MNKNKKLVSLICAIAMIFTMLSGLAITANAADEGFTMTVSEYDASTKTATATIGYKGLQGCTGGKIAIQMPSTVTAVTGDPKGTPEKLADSKRFTYTFAYGTDPKTETEATITTLTLTFSEDVIEDLDLVIADDSYAVANDGNDTKYVVGASTNPMGSASAKVHNPTAPTAKPTTTAKPGAIATPAPTADPDAQPDPTKAPVVENMGYTMTVDDSDKTSVKVTLGYHDITGGVTGGKIAIQMPDEVTAVVGDPKGTPEKLADSKRFTYTFAYGTDPKTTATDTITTLTLTLSKALENDQQIYLADDSYIVANDGNDTKYVVGKELGNVNAVIHSSTEPAATPEVKAEKTMAELINDTDAVEATKNDTPVDKSGDAAYATADEAIKNQVKKESNYFVVPNIVNTTTGEAAKYGEDNDFTATYTKADGTEVELDEAQYENLINGHFGADNLKDVVADGTTMNDVLKNLNLKFYNNSVTVQPQIVKVNRDTTGDTGVNDVVYDADTATNPTSGGGTTPTPRPTAAPTMTITTTVAGKAATSVTEKSILTAVVTVPENLKKDDGVLSDLKVDKDGYLELVSSTKAADGLSAEYKFQAIKKGTVTLSAEYAPAVAEDTELKTAAETWTKVTASTKVTITAEKSTGGSGSSGSSGSTSSGGGAIASGLVDTGVGNLFGFNDMADASWAIDAVNALAAQKIVSGVGDNKFDPNGALTRAAYAQMLVNAIGHNTDSADTEFADVPTDAWFYHNVAVAAQLGIVSGYGDGNFGPYDLITREQMALMTQKAAVVMAKSLVGADAGTFTDDADIADWSRDAVYQLANAGIINGMGDGTFAPKANATRAQAAVIIYNTFVK